MSKALIIVESPTKAKTISKFLGKDYTVKSSMGHIRDLPKSKIGVNPDENFEITYEIPAKAKKTVTELKKLAKSSDEVILATDEDREGEAISWHLAHILKLKPATAKRMVFHEITESAIKEALANPRYIDINLVDAQQARRALDRLVGYKLSPFLWKKVQRGLSAGRVQSVALRLIVDREREIEAFQSQEYWTIQGIFNSNNDKTLDISSTLTHIDNKRLDKFSFTNELETNNLVDKLKTLSYTIKSIENKTASRNPYPPFITSSLQQDAARRLYFSAKQTMMIAQQLYEGIAIGKRGQTGLITYMRTDSTNLSAQALNAAKSQIIKQFGDKYYQSRQFKTKSKNAQEAHEAIRPTDPSITPEEVQSYLDDKQYKLYALIWSRFMASQMKPAIFETMNVSIQDIEESKYTFSTSGKRLVFDGFMRVYDLKSEDVILPNIAKGENLTTKKIEGEQHFTQPPARYSESSLVKALETNAIGRPSTYASIISTIQTRGYVVKNEDRRFAPTDIGKVVTDMLVEHFPQIVDIEFTAKVEEQFDEISLGKDTYQNTMAGFYNPFEKILKEKDKTVDRHREIITDRNCPECGGQLELKRSKFGKFIACTNYPECKYTDKSDEEKKLQADFGGEKCPNCEDGVMEVKSGRFGPFLGCSNYPTCKTIKKIENKTGEKCPECQIGDMVMKKGKRGPFKACNRYPECKHIEGVKKKSNFSSKSKSKTKSKAKPKKSA
jgi:DNA topoisomerase-1